MYSRQVRGYPNFKRLFTIIFLTDCQIFQLVYLVHFESFQVRGAVVTFGLSGLLQMIYHPHIFPLFGQIQRRLPLPPTNIIRCHVHTSFQCVLVWPSGLYLDVLCIDVSIGLQQQADDRSVSGQYRPVQSRVLMIFITQIH